MSLKGKFTMKFLFVLTAVVLTTSAMPTKFGVDFQAVNGTARVPAGQAGFATLNGGTVGGQGGSTFTVWDAFALRDAVANDARKIVIIRGRIDLTVLFVSSPGIFIRVGSYTTIEGGDRNAEIVGGGLRFYNGHQFIMHNFKMSNVLSYAPGERPNGMGGITGQIAGPFSEIDAVDIETSTNVWINHCEFSDDPWNSLATPTSGRRHDGLIDIKRASNWISISNNIFRNHNHCLLVGHSDSNASQDVGKLKVTYYLNWFQGTVQRNPRVRFGEVHILNNLYTDIVDYGVGIGAGAMVYGERNAFINTRRAWGYPSGTPNPMGHFYPYNNLLTNSGFDSGITGSAVTWRPANYYSYTPMANSRVEAHVRTYAGTI